MRFNNDPWRYARELVALGMVAIVVSFSVTILAVARRARDVEGALWERATVAAPDAAGGFPAPESVAIVFTVAFFVGLGAFAAQVAKERRGSRRYPCRLPSPLIFAGEAFDARLVNISETGAMLKTKGYSLREGDRILLTLAGNQVNALVVWTDTGRAGVKFSLKLDYEVFRTILRSARKRDGVAREAQVETPGTEKAPAPPAREPSTLSVSPTPVARRPLS